MTSLSFDDTGGTDGPSLAELQRVDALVRARAETLTVPWLVATALIGVFSTVISLRAEAGDEHVEPVSATLFALLALAFGAASVLVPRKQLGDAAIRARLRAQLEVRDALARLRLPEADRVTFTTLSRPMQRLVAVTTLFDKPYLVGLALAGGVALTGFAYGLFISNLLYAMPHLLLAFALDAYHYPRFRLPPLVERARKLERAEDERNEVAAAMKEARAITTQAARGRPGAS